MSRGADVRTRRYLLDQMSEDERAAVEQEYFASEGSLEEMAAAEDALIEDYLEGTLAAEDRERFERDYLASPTHRQRVEVIRRLTIAAAPSETDARTAGEGPSASAVTAAAGGPPRWMRPLSLAAAVLLGVAITFWLLPRETEAPSPGAIVPPPVADGGAAAPPPVPPPAPPPSIAPVPRILAMSLSPSTTRAGDDARPLVIPAEVDIVALSLDGERGAASPSRATIATVAGESVWRGEARASERAGVMARLDVPANVLRPEDYIVTLHGRAGDGAERELERYFLRVRAR